MKKDARWPHVQKTIVYRFPMPFPGSVSPNGAIFSVLVVFQHPPVFRSDYRKKVLYLLLRNRLEKHFFLLNMLWSRHVKPSPAIGEKSERSEIKDIKVCTD